MDVVRIERIEEEERGGGRSYSTRGATVAAGAVHALERGRGAAARAIRGAGNAGRRASPTAGKREGFFLLISCLIRLIHLLFLYREDVLLDL
jgi:hypothetical protein